MIGGAWPFLVGGVICLLYCDNERDSSLLNRRSDPSQSDVLLRGTSGVQPHETEQKQVRMPLDVRGRTRATLKESACALHRRQALVTL